MKVVILCGGEGTRMREQTEKIPKPLIEIGGRPILWHIMKMYSSYGFNDFILCLGYKGGLIKKYFVEHEWRISNFTLNTKKSEINYHNRVTDEWKITFVDTGIGTTKGERIKKIKDYIEDDDFFVAYGDDVSDVNIKDVLKFHKKHGKVVTLTTINPHTNFGLLKLNEKGDVVGFKEKPRLEQWINAGFFVFNRKVFDYLKDGWELEDEVFRELAKKRQLKAYQHDGFWACMNTFKDMVELNSMWDTGTAPWKVW